MEKYKQLIKLARDTSQNWRVVDAFYRSSIRDVLNDTNIEPITAAQQVERLTGIMRNYAKRRGETFHALRVDY